MNSINLIGKPNLEELLKEANVPSEEIASIKNERGYFDEYYLTPDGNIVKVFYQEFRKDAWMKLSSVQEVRLITYPTDMNNIQELQDIFNKDDIPIITRAKGSMVDSLKNYGFRDIKNIDGNPTVLLPIKFPIPKTLPSGADKHIHPMSGNDLDKIEELFKNEYSLRYRMVRMMYNDCPEACFVYKDKRKVIGVTFNKIEGDELYMRQIFVREDFRGQGIGRRIYNARLRFAMENELESAHGNIRLEARALHMKYNPELSFNDVEYYLIRPGDENGKINK